MYHQSVPMADFNDPICVFFLEICRALTRISQIKRAKESDRDITIGFFAAVGLMLTMQSTSESTIGDFESGLLNGGAVALVYEMIVAVFRPVALAASLGEMASM